MASEIVVMSSGSAEPGLDHVGAAFEQATGTKVRVVYNDDIGEFDVVVASNDALERKFRPAGRIEGAAVPIGRLGFAIAVRPGAPVPQVSTLDDVVAAIVSAHTVLITENHTSGLYFESALKRLGIAEPVEDRLVRLRNGPAVMERLLAGSGTELAFLSVNEFRTYEERGMVVAGDLAPELQHLREFSAIPSPSSGNLEAAWQFAHFCGGPGRAELLRHGFI